MIIPAAAALAQNIGKCLALYPNPLLLKTLCRLHRGRSPVPHKHGCSLKFYYHSITFSWQHAIDL
ncbi:hypothetical protein CK934_05800 [Chitinophaga sp. MD30]|nr:hypothetical protein CK934_05800 [Chitinophaga sp. MD30]